MRCRRSFPFLVLLVPAVLILARSSAQVVSQHPPLSPLAGREIVLPPGMVLVPAGTFEMGRHVGFGNSRELPVHPVTLDAFYMDVYEVTNEKYAAYLNKAYAQGRVTVSIGTPGGEVYQVGGAAVVLCSTTTHDSYTRITWDGSMFGVTAGKEDHPVVMVSWWGACAYANSLSRDYGLTPCYDETSWDCDFSANGCRLPTEAEWEYAARGGEHNPYYKYPWGDTIVGSMTNWLDSGDPYETGPYPWTTPVGYYDGNQIPSGVDMANGYGLYDMCGSAWEWCWDWMDSDYYSYSPTHNPTGPISGSFRVNRGGSWYVPTYAVSAMRSAFRAYMLPWHYGHSCGFRVVAVRP